MPKALNIAGFPNLLGQPTTRFAQVGCQLIMRYFLKGN